MKSSEVTPQTMTSPGFFSPQRVLWGAILFVAFILIYYANAPVIPVLVGCLLAVAVTALRSSVRSSNNRRDSNT
jgi:hypothetical protein